MIFGDIPCNKEGRGGEREGGREEIIPVGMCVPAL